MRSPSNNEAAPGRRRKYLLVGSALGLLLAAFVGFLLAPEGGGDTSIRLYAPNILTDEFHRVIASFAVTNTGEKGITLVTMATQFRTNGQWSVYKARYNVIWALQPGQSTNVPGLISQDGQKWRGELVWHGHATRLQRLRNRFHIKVGSVIPSLRPDSAAWQNYVVHTNFSPEFTY